jgi:hypothetical protein
MALRLKVLLGIAALCAGYVIVMPDASQTVEPVRDAGAGKPHRTVTAAATGGSPLVKTAFRMSDRIVSPTSAAALFAAQSWIVAPPPPPPPPPSMPAPPPAPVAPPLPYAFMGSYRPEGDNATYFLTAGDRVYDVRVGDTLDNTYTVDGVSAGQLLLTYIPLKFQQAIAVGEER